MCIYGYNIYVYIHIYVYVYICTREASVRQSGGEMNGGKDFEAGPQRHVVPVQVPIGWQRRAEPSKGVIYISPSGSVLASYDHVKAYLLTDGTCKCGLECPLVLHKVFSFDPGALVKQRTAEDVRSDEDVTKLCIHKRKLLAVAALHRSIETHPALVTGAPATIPPHSTTQRAIRTIPHVGLPHRALPDCESPFKMLLAAGHQHQPLRQYPTHEVAAAHPGELYPGYPRPHRLGGADAGPKSPYMVGYGGMLSPPPSSSKLYGDGPHSPITETLGSPDGVPGGYRTTQCGFPGAVSVHGNGRTPPSPASMRRHGSPLSQSACAMTGRTRATLSPTDAAKSPVVSMPRTGNVRHGTDVPRAVFHHRPQPAPPPGAPLQAPPPPACALQPRLMTSSEKDPLGILDPIPSKPVGLCPSPGSPNPSGFPPGLHSQVPMMNVNAPPPAIVPLASNLPVPTGKTGPAGHTGHVQRSHQAGPAPSMSPAPVTSPVHMSGRVEASPHRSRPPSTSLDHGNFAIPSGHQAHPGSVKVPSSPRSAMCSPLPAMPSSPSSNKADRLHQYIDSQMPSGMAGSVGAPQRGNPMFFPPSSSPSSLSTQSASQKGPPGLLGMPLNQILNQQKAASFPASSLLSAAAKAQLAYQNQHAAADHGPAAFCGGAGSGNTVPGGGGGGGEVTEAGSRPLGFRSSPRGMEGHSTLNHMLPPHAATPLSAPEAQSGRAALRDKLMAQQRDPLRKRKQPSAANHEGGNGMAYSMLSKSGPGGPRVPAPCGPVDPPRQGARAGGLPPSTSMAQLLQSMSHQGSHLMAGAGPGPGLHAEGPPGANLLHCGDGPNMGVSRGPPQHLQVQQGLRGPGAPTLLHSQKKDGAPGGQLGPRPHPHPQHHPGQEMMTQMHASALGHRGPPRPGVGPDGMPLGHLGAHPPPLSHPGPSLQQQNLLHHGMRRPGMAAMARSIGDGSCGLVNAGNPSPLSCSMGGMQSLGSGPGAQMYQKQLKHQQLQRQQFQQGMQHAGPPHQNHQPNHPYHPNHPYQGQQHFPDHPPHPDGTNLSSMPFVYQNYQQGMMTNQGQYGDGLQPPRPQHLEPPSKGEGLSAGPPGDQAVDAIYRAVVDAARKGVHVTITTTLSGTTQAAPSTAMSAFAGSVCEPVGLSRPISSALHGLREAEAPSRCRGAGPGAGPPQKTPDPGKGTPEPGDLFGSPGRGTPRGLWEGELRHGSWFDGQSGGNAAAWGGEEFLECSTQVRSSPCAERPAGPAPRPPCPPEVSQDLRKGYPDGGGVGYRTTDGVVGRGPAHYSELPDVALDLCGQLNGAAPGRLYVSRGGYGDALGPPRQELTGDDQSPGSSTSLDGPLATGRDYGPYNGRCYGGAVASPSDTKSPSSEEELRGPDSPYRARGFRVGEVLWGPLRGLPPWPARLAGEQQGQRPREQVKVEPETLKTLTHDLEAFDRATKRNRRPGKLNNHLEAAIHEAMSELDKISGTVHQMPSRERQVRAPKAKRRKISR
ncbi:methyl-CpG-binding domain protein 5-like isoform X1 [Gadus macrocephalus]|uniref:methyl-CpG-binding domain protein 5-like isoform X1 n=1 Tax=Gadus macrocephalus TaxID=80720 RepID=UPI0028CB2829|nr:methyl-CpG-binding domain protein 5-like isoform X1 [Gadus macrocephalus]